MKEPVTVARLSPGNEMKEATGRNKAARRTYQCEKSSPVSAWPEKELVRLRAREDGILLRKSHLRFFLED